MMSNVSNGDANNLRQSEKHSTPNLDMQYPPPLAPTLPRTEATLTSRPRARFTSGRKASVTSITPIMLTRSVLWKSSTCIHSVGPMGMERPALLTRPHSPARPSLQLNPTQQKLLGSIRVFLHYKLWDIICRQSQRGRNQRGVAADYLVYWVDLPDLISLIIQFFTKIEY